MMYRVRWSGEISRPLVPVVSVVMRLQAQVPSGWGSARRMALRPGISSSLGSMLPAFQGLLNDAALPVNGESFGVLSG